jgi:adenylate kinase family enzyme
MQKSGQRTVVVGVSASGKSTFARKLSQKTRTLLIHMDTIWWKPGWTEVGEEEASEQIKSIISATEWIIEGYIPKDARAAVFERADTILYLDYSPLVASWRYIKRWWRHRKNPRPELEGSPEKFNFNFLRLVWNKGEAISLNEYLSKVVDQKKIIIFRSPSEANEFLR